MDRAGELRTGIVGLLVREVLLAPREGQRPFSADVRSDVERLAETGPRGPGPGIRIVEDWSDEALRQLVREERPDPGEFDAALDSARRGLTSSADLARLTKSTYGSALLQRPAGMLFTMDAAPLIRAAGQRAAAVALECGQCVVDLSTASTLAVLDVPERLALLGQIGRKVIAAAAVDDAVATREQLRGHSMATFTVTLGPDGELERREVSATHRAILVDSGALLESIASGMQVHHQGGREQLRGLWRQRRS